MIFQCSLCRHQCDEYVFFQSHCSTCEEIRRIISLYNKEDILTTLRTVYLRDSKPIENRTNRLVENKVRKSVRIAEKPKEQV